MKYILIAAGTAMIIAFSWIFSLKEKRYHGIARFFSFESIFILLILNIRHWFRDPFSLHQLISWILLFGSLYPAIAGYLLLKSRGKSEDSFENTTVLVKSGIYKYIRHPLYCSLMLLGTGVMFKDPRACQLILGAINLIAIYLTARIEEKEMASRFGESYLQYMKETRMFIPYIL
ncbi:MAG: isoprenylcysteine carboxylmethyltransferase family protein [Bacteroidales bacterium]|jgi:protein-S-isoprenylcysteine O-methyltransferase Ste14